MENLKKAVDEHILGKDIKEHFHSYLTDKISNLLKEENDKAQLEDDKD